jgi:hypothetical protein
LVDIGDSIPLSRDIADVVMVLKVISPSQKVRVWGRLSLGGAGPTGEEAGHPDRRANPHRKIEVIVGGLHEHAGPSLPRGVDRGVGEGEGGSEGNIFPIFSSLVGLEGFFPKMVEEDGWTSVSGKVCREGCPLLYSTKEAGAEHVVGVDS